MRTTTRTVERSKAEALGAWATFASCLLTAKAAGKSHVSAQSSTDPATGLCIKDSSLLDPACKSGVFLREIAKRLIEGLEGE